MRRERQVGDGAHAAEALPDLGLRHGDRVALVGQGVHFEAATGKVLWRYQPKIDEERGLMLTTSAR